MQFAVRVLNLFEFNSIVIPGGAREVEGSRCVTFLVIPRDSSTSFRFAQNDVISEYRRDNEAFHSCDSGAC
jgi:hypothetical protein